MFPKLRSSEEKLQQTILVAPSYAPNDFKEVKISRANSVFFNALSEIQTDFEKLGQITASSLAKFRDSTPLARQRITELKSMKKTFLRELEIEANKGNEPIKKNLVFYEALIEADRLRTAKHQRGKGKGGNSKSQ